MEKQVVELLAKKQTILQDLADAEIRIASAHRSLAEIRKELLLSEDMKNGVVSVGDAMRWS